MPPCPGTERESASERRRGHAHRNLACARARMANRISSKFGQKPPVRAGKRSMAQNGHTSIAKNATPKGTEPHVSHQFANKSTLPTMKLSTTMSMQNRWRKRVKYRFGPLWPNQLAAAGLWLAAKRLQKHSDLQASSSKRNHPSEGIERGLAERISSKFGKTTRRKD